MIEIRTAVTQDAVIISDYNCRLAGETENKTLDSDIVGKGVQALLDDGNKGQYYVAEIEQKLVGQLMITREWSDWRNAYFWWIQSVYVSQDCRGSGVFSALFNFVYDKACSSDDVCGIRLYVERNNEIALKTYGKLGFVDNDYQLREILCR